MTAKRAYNVPLAAALFLALFLMTGGSAKADPIVITFDDVPQGELLSSSYTTVTVLFSSFTNAGRFNPESGGVIVSTAANANTAPNAAFARGLAFGSDFRNIAVDLYPAGTTPPLTDYISFYVVGTQAGQTDPWRAVAFFGGVEHVITGTTDTLVVFSSATFDIRGFEFYPSSSREGIDTVSFNPHPVPEPATLVLLGAGLAGAAVRLRKRRRGERSSGDDKSESLMP